MTKLQDKLKNDNQTQITYSYLRSSGTEKGHAGKDVYCDTVSAPQYGPLCHNGTLQKSKKKDWFKALAGPWKDLLHK